MNQEERIAQLEKQVAMLIASDRYTLQKKLQIFDGRNLQVGKTTGTKFGTETTQKIGFFNATPIVQQTGGANSAAGTYGSNEQGMINTMYNALRNFGFLS